MFCPLSCELLIDFRGCLLCSGIDRLITLFKVNEGGKFPQKL